MNSATILTRDINIYLSNFRKGAISTTDVNLGTTPEVTVQLMDATNELVTVSFTRPLDWDSGTDLTFVIGFELVNVEINNDTLDMTFDYVITEQITTAAGITKASTNTTGQTTVTTANGLAIGDTYLVTVTLPAADGTNPLSANWVQGHVEFHLTNVTGVGEIHLTGGRIVYEAAY